VNGNFTAFYRDALRYLGCIDIQTELNAEERLVYAFDLSLAALLSDEIYNFGELVCVLLQIAHPILDTLKGTDKEWLLKLVYCFNSGDINGYESLQPQWHTQACPING
jgi:26S proteasome regulatory subunit N9